MSYESKRQQILAEFVSRLATIRTANGYNTEAGATIFSGEAPQFGPDDPTTALALVVGDDETGYQGENVKCDWPIDVQGFVRATSDPATVIEELISDIKRAVEQPDRTLGGLLVPRGIERGNTRALKRETGSEYVGAAVEYRVTFCEKWGAP